MSETTAAWGERVGVRAGTTSRADGSFGLTSPEPVADVIARWRAFRLAQAPAFCAVQRAHQVHGARVIWHEHVAPGLHESEDADGHATSQRGLLLSVTIADCVPLFLADRAGREIALLHAGWRGVAVGILKEGVALLASHGIPAAGLALHCGVAICGKCYEVGPEVARAVLGAGAKPGTTHLDLRAAVAAQAARIGITEVSTSPDCPSCDRDRYFSHRASRGEPGRQIAYLGLPRA